MFDLGSSPGPAAYSPRKILGTKSAIFDGPGGARPDMPISNRPPRRHHALASSGASVVTDSRRGSAVSLSAMPEVATGGFATAGLKELYDQFY